MTDDDLHGVDDLQRVKHNKSVFSFKTHPILLILGINFISISIIFCLFSGGHPINALNQIIRGIAYNVLKPEGSLDRPSEEEQIQADKDYIQNYFKKLYGGKVVIQIKSFERKTGQFFIRRYPQLYNTPVGNIFTQIDGKNYYLSKGKERLYEVSYLKIPDEKPTKVVILEKPVPKSEDPSIKKIGDIYQDKDGTWRNY